MLDNSFEFGVHEIGISKRAHRRTAREIILVLLEKDVQQGIFLGVVMEQLDLVVDYSGIRTAGADLCIMST